MSAVAEYPSGLSWDEFLALPHELRNASLIDGEVVVNPPNALHELVVKNLLLIVSTWTAGGDGRGEVSTQQPVKISDRRGYQPDFAWYPPERCAPATEPPSFTGLPGLVVEVLSRSTRTFDLVRKRGDYERVGIGEVWFVDPDAHQVLTLLRPHEGAPFVDAELGDDDRLTSQLLPGLVVEVAALFRR